MNLIKNFLWKNKIAISACVLTIAFGVGYWVISSPGPTTIGEDITVGNDLYVTGNVGIGTEDPNQKLDVSGEIHATGDICTDQGGGICLGAVYDSGWFDVVKGGTYSKTHNLGTDKLIINVFFRPSPDEDVTLVYFTHSQYNEDCPQVTKITSNSFVIQAGANTVALVLDSTGNYVGYESGQYRVVAMSLGS